MVTRIDTTNLLLKRLLAAFMVIAPLALSGCRTAAPPVTLHPRAGQEDFLTQLRENFEAIESMKAVGSVVYTDPEAGAESLKVIIVYARPDDLRITGYKSYTPNLFDFLLQGDSWLLYMRDDKRALEGDVAELRTLGGPWHAIAAVTAGLLGRLFEVSAPEIQGFVKNTTEWVMTLTLSATGEDRYITELYFAPGDIRLRKQIFIDPDGIVFAEVAFSEYRSYDGVWFPKEWNMILTPTQERIDVSIGKLDMAPELDEQVFEILMPRTVEVEHIR